MPCRERAGQKLFYREFREGQSPSYKICPLPLIREGGRGIGFHIKLGFPEKSPIF
jgi:hypothetical protein